MSARGAAPLDPPEAEIARPLLAIAVESVHGTARSDIHSERTGFATKPESDVARPETEIAPVASPSFGDIAAVISRNQSVESGSEAGVEAQSGYPPPARQEPEITPIPYHSIANQPSFVCYHC